MSLSVRIVGRNASRSVWFRGRRLAGALVTAVAASLVVGCGGNDGRPPTAAVSGVVTYKGNPVAKATVQFIPSEKGARSGRATTDDRGRYQIGTFELADGAVLGAHKVSIEAREDAAPVEASANLASALADEVQERAAGSAKPRIPEKYFRVETSGLTMEVKAGSNTRDFELVD